MNENEIFFLQEAFIQEANHLLRLPGEAVTAFLESIRKIKGDPSLMESAWQYYKVFFDNSGMQKGTPSQWPPFPSEMGIWKGMFPAVVLLSGLPSLTSFYKEKNIPESILIDTLSDVAIWLDDYHKKEGLWGLKEFPWLMNHFSGRLYRLGRLQFIAQPFNGKIRVFRNRQTRRVVALSEADIPFRKDGQVDGTNGIFDRESGWISRLKIDEDGIQGNPILPQGYAQQEIMKLSFQEWDPVLTKGDGVLDMHIATGSKMSHSSCGESLLAAASFYPKYFPEKSFTGFTCSSWLLGPQLQKILPPTSNIYRFQREFYLYPILADDKQTFERVFGGKPEDFSAAPRDTQLRRGILSHVMSGQSLYSAAGFILKEDASAWGTEKYQRTTL